MTLFFIAPDGQQGLYFVCAACGKPCWDLSSAAGDVDLTELILTCGWCGRAHRPVFEPTAPWAATPEDLA